MIERIARRAGGFASTTALRWIRAAEDAAPVELLPARKPRTSERLRGPVMKGAAMAGTLALASSSNTVRRGVATSLKKMSASLRTEGSSAPSRNRTAATGSGASRSNGSNGSDTSGRNGSGGSLLKKTRAELYEMAKKKDIPGRSNMTKDDLTKALKG